MHICDMCIVVLMSTPTQLDHTVELPQAHKSMKVSRKLHHLKPCPRPTMCAAALVSSTSYYGWLDVWMACPRQHPIKESLPV